MVEEAQFFLDTSNAFRNPSEIYLGKCQHADKLTAFGLAEFNPPFNSRDLEFAPQRRRLLPPLWSLVVANDRVQCLYVHYLFPLGGEHNKLPPNRGPHCIHRADVCWRWPVITAEGKIIPCLRVGCILGNQPNLALLQSSPRDTRYGCRLRSLLSLSQYCCMRSCVRPVTNREKIGSRQLPRWPRVDFDHLKLRYRSLLYRLAKSSCLITNTSEWPECGRRGNARRPRATLKKFSTRNNRAMRSLSERQRVFPSSGRMVGYS